MRRICLKELETALEGTVPGDRKQMSPATRHAEKPPPTQTLNVIFLIFVPSSI